MFLSDEIAPGPRVLDAAYVGGTAPCSSPTPEERTVSNKATGDGSSVSLCGRILPASERAARSQLRSRVPLPASLLPDRFTTASRAQRSIVGDSRGKHRFDFSRCVDRTKWRF